MKAIAYRHTDEHGQTSHLVYDTDDVETFETPRDVIGVTKAGDTCVRRELGQAHLLLHFREGTRPAWEPVETGEDPGLASGGSVSTAPRLPGETGCDLLVPVRAGAAPAETELRLMIRNGDPEVVTLIRKMIRTGVIQIAGGAR